MCERRRDRGSVWAAYTRAAGAYATAQQDLVRLGTARASASELMRARQRVEDRHYALQEAYRAWQQLPADTHQTQRSLTLHPGSG